MKPSFFPHTQPPSPPDPPPQTLSPSLTSLLSLLLCACGYRPLVAGRKKGRLCFFASVAASPESKTAAASTRLQYNGSRHLCAHACCQVIYIHIESHHLCAHACCHVIYTHIHTYVSARASPTPPLPLSLGLAELKDEFLSLDK